MARQPVHRIAGRVQDGTDGVRVLATGGVRKRIWLLAMALALVALAIVVLVLSTGGTPDPEPPLALRADAPIAQQQRDEPAPRAAANGFRAHRIESAPSPPTPAVAPAKEDAPFSFGPPGEKTGIALFPPPGTKPIKIGIVVPDDFELPAGYVRHFQATDDGSMLEPILLFHPDYEWVDGSGAPLALPADRVVPPELAPEGLPIRMLVPPTAQDATR